jgi:sec-independent protein translocase protein TatA
MFTRIGVPELLLVLGLALVVFGPKKLPEIGKSFGRGLREFKEATKEVSQEVAETTGDKQE